MIQIPALVTFKSKIVCQDTELPSTCQFVSSQWKRRRVRRQREPAAS